MRTIHIILGIDKRAMFFVAFFRKTKWYAMNISCMWTMSWIFKSHRWLKLFSRKSDESRNSNRVFSLSTFLLHNLATILYFMVAIFFWFVHFLAVDSHTFSFPFCAFAIKTFGMWPKRLRFRFYYHDDVTMIWYRMYQSIMPRKMEWQNNEKRWRREKKTSRKKLRSEQPTEAEIKYSWGTRAFGLNFILCTSAYFISISFLVSLLAICLPHTWNIELDLFLITLTGASLFTSSSEG